VDPSKSNLLEISHYNLATRDLLFQEEETMMIQRIVDQHPTLIKYLLPLKQPASTNNHDHNACGEER
jgi:hypothetical protein